jgi:CrcB protein
MMQLILIGTGGAVGSILRYLVQKSFSAKFPVGTLSVNLIGCFVIGLLWAISVKGMPESMRYLLMTGFCGGFTTFSAFGLETVQMMAYGRWTNSFLYILASVTGGIMATFFGYKILSV